MLKLIFFFLNFIYSTKIAIIGAGIGGSSSSFYLTKYNHLEVDLYEKSDRIGGRVYSKEFYNITINLGASFIIKENALIYSLVKELGLELISTGDEGDENTAIINGNKVIMKFSKYQIVNILKLLWNYGFSPLKVKMICDHYLKKFLRLYDYLKEFKTFNSLHDLLNYIELDELVHKSTKEFLIQNGISEKYIDEIINAFIGGIYNQHSEINAFSGFVTLSGVSYETFEVKGGNDMIMKKIFEILKDKKNFNLYLNSKIDSITKENNTYILNGKKYDYVIIACPIEKTDIKFNNITINNTGPHEFQKTYVTLINGEINEKFFDVEKNYFNTLLSGNKNKSEHISDAIYINDRLIKVQSDEKLKDLNLINGNNVFEQVWEFAYPKLIPIQLSDLPKFILSDKLFYINAIESAGSCMELSMISSRNIINMIVSDLNDNVKHEL